MGVRCQGPKDPRLLRDRLADGVALAVKFYAGLCALYAGELWWKLGEL